jgi:peptidoglycan/xylan/chitin deacetylase (PgdA/CDA1 family)
MSAVKDIQVCINPHFDAVSLWIGSYGGADSASDISRGVLAAKRGVPRLLELFRRYGIKPTWHITGHSMESFPRAADMIIEAAGEIGIHGYTHENPQAMTRQQEAEVLDKTIELVLARAGKKPTSYAAPWCEFSDNSIDLLLSRGITCDSTMMEDDFHPYYLRKGDRWKKIDYSKPTSDWMVPWTPGTPVDIVEISPHWHLSDASPTIFVKTLPNSQGWLTGQQIGQIWTDHFDWVYRNHDYATYPICFHPDAAVRPHVLMAIERLIVHMLQHSGVRMVTHAEAAADYRRRVPFHSIDLLDEPWGPSRRTP